LSGVLIRPEYTGVKGSFAAKSQTMATSCEKNRRCAGFMVFLSDNFGATFRKPSAKKV
jgi:hypothetical protein